MLPPDLDRDVRRVLDEWLLGVVQANVAADPELPSADVELQITADGKSAHVAHFHIDGAALTLVHEPSLRPTVVIKVHADDGLAMLEGVLDPRAALTDGRLRISGDVALATQLAPLLVPR